MEIPFDLGTIFETSCVRMDTTAFKKFNPRKYAVLVSAIDKMGKLSADAQKLKKVLTSYEKILESEDQILYLLWEPSSQHASYSSILGYLKVGRRKLYLYDGKLQCYQRRPVCVLDIYVHFTRQRQGNGKRLYDEMLHGEHVLPHMIAIDKPSDSLLAFLQKHYHLTDPVWQNTNYVVFNSFFSSTDELPPDAQDYATPDSLEPSDLVDAVRRLNVVAPVAVVNKSSPHVAAPPVINKKSSPRVPIVAAAPPSGGGDEEDAWPNVSPVKKASKNSSVNFNETPPPMSPTSSDATSNVLSSYSVTPTRAPPASASRYARDQKVTSLSHQKLW